MSCCLRELTRAQCLGRLRAHTVGRVAITSRALPMIVPVNYTLVGSAVVFRTEPDGMLARACRGSVVAFEIDELAADGAGGWSVLVVGVASLLDGTAAIRAAQSGLVSAAGPGRDQFVAVTIGQLSGREVLAAAAVG